MNNMEEFIAQGVLLLGTFASGYVVGKSVRSKEVAKHVTLFDEVSRKAQEYFTKIEEVISEREVWRTWYHDQASGHDNAQALMMGQIEDLVQQYRKKVGEHPKVSPAIAKVRGDFVEEHGPEARAQKEEGIGNA